MISSTIFFSLFKTGYESTKLIHGLFITETMHLLVHLVIVRRAEGKLGENLKAANPWCTNVRLWLVPNAEDNLAGFPGSNTSPLEHAKLQTFPASSAWGSLTSSGLTLLCFCDGPAVSLPCSHTGETGTNSRRNQEHPSPDSVWWTSEECFSGHLERGGSQTQGVWWDLSPSSWLFLSQAPNLLVLYHCLQWRSWIFCKNMTTNDSGRFCAVV